MRLEGPSKVLPGQQVTFSLYLDHGFYPATEENCATHVVRALSFGIELPPGCLLVAHRLATEYASYVPANTNGFFGVTPSEGGIVGGLIADLTGDVGIPAGVDQKILELDFTVPAGMAGAVNFELKCVDGVECLVIAECGHVAPHKRGKGVTVEDPDATITPDAYTFPVPTSDELELQFAESGEEEGAGTGEGSGGGPVGGIAGGPDGDGFCDYEVIPIDPETGLEEALPDCVLAPTEEFILSVGPNGEYADIGLALATIPAAASLDVYICVEFGQYPGFSVDLNTWNTGQRVTIYSENGPGLSNSNQRTEINGQVEITYGVGFGDSTKVLRLGWVDVASDGATPPPEPYVGWRGFYITDPSPPPGVANQGAIRLETGFSDSGGASVEIRGNIITGPTSGVNCDDCRFAARIIHNNIHANGDAVDGQLAGGIRVHNAFSQGYPIVIARNWIHDNTVVDIDSPNTSRSRGAGINVTDGMVEICDNQIYDNVARQGAGIGLRDLSFMAVEQYHHVEGNDIRDNTLVTGPGFLTNSLGGGIYVFFEDEGGTVISRRVSFLNNTIHGNFAISQGGGLYMNMPHATDGTTAPSVIEGNFIYANSAQFFGGGAVLGYFAAPATGATLPDPNDRLRVYHNTFSRNTLITSTGVGSEVYLPLLSTTFGIGANEHSWVEGVNNILEIPPTGQLQRSWFAAAGPGGPPAPLGSGWSNTHLAQEIATGVEYDLFGVGCSALDPELAIPGIDPHLLGKNSPPVNQAVTVVLSRSLDVDGDARDGSSFGAPDQGADELETYPFIRGDADGSGSVIGLVDSLYLLDYGFSGGPPPPCFDAADVDGNDSVNGLLDSLYLLNYQFSGGPVPPVPFPLCGEDPPNPAEPPLLGTPCPPSC